MTWSNIKVETAKNKLVHFVDGGLVNITVMGNRIILGIVVAFVAFTG